MTTELTLTARSKAYLGGVIALGSVVVAWSAFDVYSSAVPRDWLFLAGLTALTGSFTIRVPRVRARISVSDAFVFASVMLFGPATATVIVALDSIVAAAWGRNNGPLRTFFNLTATSLSIWLAANAFYAFANVAPGAQNLPVGALLGPLFVLAAVYFLVNTWLVAIALSIERRTNVGRLWLETFPFFALNYFGGVSVAALLVSYTKSVDLAAVGIILPLLVISYLTYRSSLGRVADAQRHVDQVNELYMSTIETLAMAVDAKDQITHGHIRRVQVYAVELAKRLGVKEQKQLRAIEAAALLHDMGKLAIPEHILNKPGKLTAAEFDKMKRHADIGADLLSEIRFPYPVVPIVRHHHEHWNGMGYPSKISGTDIPLGARILSVVDCFDALNSDRPYRPRLTHEEAFQILQERRGTMYDPLVVDTFIAAYPEIAPVAIKAGQEARSIIDVSSFADGSATPLRQISDNANETTILRRSRDEILGAASVDRALQSAAQALRQLTPATVFALYLYDSGADSVRCEATAGDPENFLTGLVIPLGERVTGWSAATRRTSLNSDASLDLAAIAQHFRPALRSTMSAPLRAQDELLGVLTAYSPRSEAFSEANRYSVEEVASALAASIAGLSKTQVPNILSFQKHRS
jgi:putative nucleotidyltransferase with HDIG domain